ncbi:MAG: ABC transporter substrate-binding protein, partial [Chloroflexi bacterium]|nr:ABC transporter substrate-binding protein [Chloroflexota bacterium]
QKFVTLADLGETRTAKLKSVVYYPEDLFDKVKWHDGSQFDMADIIMGLILTFDRAKEASPIYDESYKDSFAAFMKVFKGVRIVSEDPLVIEWYTDAYNLDAELNVNTLWPQYGYGEGAWHTIAVGMLAEANQELAFTQDKADALEVEWMNYVAGPSLEILAKYLDQALNETYIPYEPTLGQYITKDEAAQRYQNLKAWYEDKGHFWVGTGPFYLDQVFPLEKTVILKRFEDYPDPADKWLGFGEPKLATVTMEGPARVSKASGEAVFDVYVTYKDEPYPADEIMGVKWLLFDATGQVVAEGDAELVEDGHYQVVLGADVLDKLTVGANRMEVAVTSKLVSIPALGSVEFLVLP